MLYKATFENTDINKTMKKASSVQKTKNIVSMNGVSYVHENFLPNVRDLQEYFLFVLVNNDLFFSIGGLR